MCMNNKQTIGFVTGEIKVKRAIWNIVSVILFKPFVTNAFRYWRNAILKLFGAKISWKANVYASCKIWAPWNLVMEEGTCLGPGVKCYNQAVVHLKRNATVSQYAYLCTAGHDVSKGLNAKEGLVIAPILIEKDAWVGTNAFIGMGVTIGEGAVVGATASVFKAVEPWTVVGGNPAIFIKKRDIHG